MIRTRTSQHVFPAFQPPVPFGAHVVDGGVQFTVFSRNATRVWLMLFDAPDDETPSLEIELDAGHDRIGDIWHTFVPAAREGQYYLYRMNGDHRTRPGHFFDPDQWLLDPYTLAVSSRHPWGDTGGLAEGDRPTRGARFPKGVIVNDTFDWSGDVTPNIPLEDSIIYEAHLRGFTVHPTSGVAQPGTFRGFMEKIPYLRELGVTAVEFLPIQEFNELEYYMENERRKALRNYWGYSTIAFFAPHARYAADASRGRQIREFKELVLALHLAGIEVILDVVFNHTAEAGAEGPTYSFRGIDNSVYYLMDPRDQSYRNYSGCGNTMNCNHPVVRAFIMDCLRYWVREMHIDGFRFDLATVLTRGQDGAILASPPLVEEIADDPTLRHCKLIAEAWDAAGAYQVGSFPSSHWSEWNGKYRDDVRRFWKGDDGMLGAFAQRISGSADLYEKKGQSPRKSINFVTCHDGFTMHDLVSYAEKHNHANEEDNRDGERHNHNCNFGVEGPTQDAEVLRMRMRQIKNFIATLMFSQGVPMLLAGDEFGNSQNGNNNAYCQDNPISWLDWTDLDTHRSLFEFTRAAIALRKAHVRLRRGRFFKSTQESRGTPDIEWSGPNGQTPDWHHGKTLGFMLHPALGPPHRPCVRHTLFVACNADAQPATFHVPAAPSGNPWERLLFTEEQPPPWQVEQQTLRVGAHALVVMASKLDGELTER